MLAAALLELVPEKESFLAELNSIGIPNVEFSAEPATKCGITGTRFVVKVHGQEESDHCHRHEHHHHHHEHNGIQEIEEIIKHLNLSQKIKEDILAVFNIIANAESLIHGLPISDIHFHEVGSLDAVADITAVCFILDKISPDQIIVSPINVGSGQVKCAHGILPVPAPATAVILHDVPIYSTGIKGELCTPTGAALLKYFATAFGDMPAINIKAIGYGMGKKDFEAPNCVRAFLGESQGKGEKIFELACNIDDMTAEEIAFAMDKIFKAGALEVYMVPAYMKKSRPGIKLCALCREQDKESVVKAIFKHTTTLGIREVPCNRYILNRTIKTLNTPYGEVRVKESKGFGVTRAKYEFEDLARIAKEQGISISEAINLLQGKKGE